MNGRTLWLFLVFTAALADCKPVADRLSVGPELVGGSTSREEERACPLQVLVWHEIVNDLIGDRPIAVTYCPLCNVALISDRTVNGKVLDFGTSGNLRQSNTGKSAMLAKVWARGISSVDRGRAMDSTHMMSGK